MRNALIVIVTAGIVGCSGGRTLQPVEVSAPAPESTAVTMECVTRELENLGYEVPANVSTPSSVTGIRINEQPWYVRWLYGNTADQITATIEGGQLQVTASSTDPDGAGQDQPTSGASQAAVENAETVLETCSGEG